MLIYKILLLSYSLSTNKCNLKLKYNVIYIITFKCWSLIWFWVLGIESRALCMLNTHSITKATSLSLNEIDVDTKKSSKIICKSYLRKQL